ncbi:insecticidal delta-endotoxin Cry8Ea1 family protein [Bacillus cereus]|uniref:insecticidal delta-endotoxin Cry8Ea1 family protein n=1 Tax=Bacillus cereus TaxID=1396 RepID=UPI001CC138A6|nr:hypothetical protein [Bacillus cereus]
MGNKNNNIYPGDMNSETEYNNVDTNNNQYQNDVNNNQSSNDLISIADETKPFYLKTDEEIDKEWRNWELEQKGITPRIPAVAGAVASFLLKEAAKYAAKKILKGLYAKIFPSDSILTMEEILEEVEKLVDRKIIEFVRDRVLQELRGLQASVNTFNQDIEDFESYLETPPELQDMRETVINSDTGEILASAEPKSIIASINDLNQIFENRLPQFSSDNPEWKLELLPLYAQAANLHILFLRDVVKNSTAWGLNASQTNTYLGRLRDAVRNHSNYCITTYDAAFKNKFPNNDIKYMLDFRNFMVMTVLDYIPIWSMLRYEGLVMNSSANLYHYGTNTSPEHTKTSRFPYSYWKNLNKMFQGKTNKLLFGLRSEIIYNRLRDSIPSPGGPIPLPFAHAYQTYGMRTLYYGVDGSFVGSDAPHATPIDPVFLSTYSRHPGLMSQLISIDFTPVTSASHMSGGGNTLNTGIYKYKDAAGRETITQVGSPNYQIDTAEALQELNQIDTEAALQKLNQINNSYPEEYVSFPEYTVKNITALTKNINYGDLIINIHGPNDIRKTPDKYDYLESPIATFNRTKIQLLSRDGNSIAHLLPRDENIALGLTISPLHFYNVNSPVINNIEIHERFGNNGDGMFLPEILNGTTALGYDILNFSTSPVTYKVYLKVGNNDNRTCQMDVWINGVGGDPKTINTDTDNDGIIDNGKSSKIIHFKDVTIPALRNVDIGVTHTGSAAFLLGIILVPGNVTPLF